MKALKKTLWCHVCLYSFWAKWFRLIQFFWERSFQWHWSETVDLSRYL